MSHRSTSRPGTTLLSIWTRYITAVTTKMVVIPRVVEDPNETAVPPDPRPQVRAARFCAGVRFLRISFMHSGQMTPTEAGV